MVMGRIERRSKSTPGSFLVGAFQGGCVVKAGVLLLTLVAAGALFQPPALAQTPSVSRGSVVSTESPTASREAARVLRDGGTAADAAIVATLVAGVASPTSSGIGGGGFVVGWDAESGKPFVLDFRETAPENARRGPFERRPLGDQVIGHSIGVPGEVRGLYELHQRAGKLRWADLVKRAALRAHQGFPVGRHLANMLAYDRRALQKVPGFSALYYPGGKPALVGTRVTHPALGRTLDKIAAEGPEGFYSGDVAEDLVSTARKVGSPMTLADLATYRVKERKPLRVAYEGYDVYTMPPPSAGGLMVAQTLKMLPAEYLRHLGHGTPAYQHILAEAMRGAVSDRMRALGDPDFQSVDLDLLLSDERLEARRQRIALDRTHGIPRFTLDEKGTHALVTADRSGNVISLTTTINELFGAKVYAEKSGVTLNNELDDFTAKTQVAPFGMEETPNRLRPGARPVSSMTPTIVVRGSDAMLALGGSGGTAIAPNVTQALLAALVFDHDPQRAVSADRIGIPTQGAHILVEKGTSDAHRADLARRGEIVGTMSFSTTSVQMLRLDGPRPRAAADPRKHGLSLINGN